MLNAVMAVVLGYVDAGGPDSLAALTLVGLLGFCVGVAYVSALWRLASGMRQG